VAIVTNNAAAAAVVALDACGLGDLVDHVAARRGADVDHLKPAPDLLLERCRHWAWIPATR
jgi:phosphoglycolate phosphatase-like HAD superfamily hydrolase